MSNYDSISFDLPRRCSELLDRFQPLARSHGREVTFILSCASSGILVPYERLREVPEGSPPHPSQARARYPEAIRKFDELLKSNFLDSTLWKDQKPHTWATDSLSDVEREIDLWPELREPKLLSPQKKVSTVLGTLRKALAHGNIFTRGRPKIHEIIFLAQVNPNVYKFKYVLVSPSDFLIFLRNWFSFLDGINMPVFVVPEEAEVAA